jgi:hypothetical protein
LTWLRDETGLLADGDEQAEENPGFLDTLLTILENEQNPGIRLSGMHTDLSLHVEGMGGTAWSWGRTSDEKQLLQDGTC